jgi:hypothetical protein
MTVSKCICGAELQVIKKGEKNLKCPVEGIIYSYSVRTPL